MIPFLRLLALPLVPTLLLAQPRLPAESLPSPAAPESQCSNLVAHEGTLWLSWSERGAAPGERALRVASLPADAAGWTAPQTVVSTALLMENWADFASLVVGTDGALTAQWFQREAPDARGYEGWFARSTDGGRSWTAPARLGHEFVALAPLSRGRTLAVWLESTRPRATGAKPTSQRPADPARSDHEAHATSAPSMKLLARLLGPDHAVLGEWTVDPDVCTCCQNTLAPLPGDRVFLAYRGHTAGEIRDNRYALFDLASGWSPSAALRDDGWKIAACPVNGPAADAHGDALAVAWFTAAEGRPRVQVRTSGDAGRSFGPALPVDLGRPMGRIETVMLPDRSALVLWLETGQAENVAGLYARRVFPHGALSEAALIVDTAQARSSGFPRAAARPDGRVVLSWTQTSPVARVQTLLLDPRALVPGGRPVSIRRDGRGPLEFCVAPLSSNVHAALP